MHITYLLLRNNRQTGPYTLEELLQQSLQPQDLIWIEGQSSSWYSPTDIPQLVSYLSSKKVEVHPKDLPVQNTASSIIYIPPPDKAAPVHSSTEDAYDTTQAAAEDNVTAEELERKAKEIFERVQIYTQQNKEQKENTETLPIRSLQDIKQEYEGRQQNKKRTERRSAIKKSGFVGAVITIVAAIGIFFAWQYIHNKKTVSPQKPSYAKNVPDTPIAKPGTLLANRYEAAPVAQEEANQTTTVPVKKELSVDEFIDSVEKALAGSDRLYRSLPSSKAGTKKRVYPNKKEEPTQTVITSPPTIVLQPEVPKVPLASLVTVHTEYVSRGNTHTVTGLKVTVQNNSEEKLKTVVITINYYKKRDRFLNKETVQFTNIAPHSSLTLSVSVSKKAVLAKAQIEAITPAENK